ncbi:MAG: 4Fe-4S dicluster domain-containing protein [Oligoflexia bacterium]|nr:4Fe-4S dicluster domain-containing protein [Oligoflexia bacterium]
MNAENIKTTTDNKDYNSLQYGTQHRTIFFDILLVGGGPANLTLAIHLTNLIKKHNADIIEKKIDARPIDYENKIAIIEKGINFGAHSISGAILDPVALNKIIPEHLQLGFPIESKIEEEEIWYLTSKYRWKLPVIPRFLKNHGNYVVSLSKMVSWMAKQAEQNDVVLLNEVAGVELLVKDNQLWGVKTDDRQISPKHYPGYQLKAQVTILGEGSAGVLTSAAIKRFGLDHSKNPSVYELGVKEVYELNKADKSDNLSINIGASKIGAGKCIHTMGYPLSTGLSSLITSHKSGGAFLYGMAENRLAIGMVTHLSCADPHLDVHRELQQFKRHPYIQKILHNAKVVGYGAKTVPCGGLYTIPRLTHNGLMIIGDGANLLDSRKLKGLHLAMESGILAAEELFAGYLRNDFQNPTPKDYKGFEMRLKQSFIYNEMYKSRNFSQAMKMGIPLPGGPLIGVQLMTKGWNPTGNLKTRPDYQQTRPINQPVGSRNKNASVNDAVHCDEKIVIDKLTDVFLSRTTHSEDQNSHITLKNEEHCKLCFQRYDAPCCCFCPAQVYEKREKKITINFSNCLHCKCCDLKCPLDNIVWRLPEAGGGPQYTIQ